MTPTPNTRVSTARPYQVHNWGWGWWCDQCQTGVDQYSPHRQWAATEAGAQLVADLHQCDAGN